MSDVTFDMSNKQMEVHQRNAEPWRVTHVDTGDNTATAGALATAGHGTALGVIRPSVAEGKRISVVADEIRPFRQGTKLTAWEMVQEGIPCGG